MSRRFQTLLDRYAIVRRELDAERTNRRPSPMRLVRLQRLQLLINERLKDYVAQSAIRRASRPRLPARAQLHF